MLFYIERFFTIVDGTFECSCFAFLVARYRSLLEMRVKLCHKNRPEVPVAYSPILRLTYANPGGGQPGDTVVVHGEGFAEVSGRTATLPDFYHNTHF